MSSSMPAKKLLMECHNLLRAASELDSGRVCRDDISLKLLLPVVSA
jgi:hypothetical protein